MNEENLWEYASLMSKPESALLEKINRNTHLFVMHPRMLSGHIPGAFLRMISFMIQPMRILEIGTYTGYSCICLSAGLKKGGEIITIEHDPELEETALTYFKEAEIDKNVKMLIGEASDIVSGLEGLFDLVFIDADKRNYPELYESVFQKTRPGGYIIADNVLWAGKVLTDTPSSDRDTQGIKEFNIMIKNDKRADNVLLPFNDGIMLIRKL